MSYLPKFQLTEHIRTNLHEIERLNDRLQSSRVLPEVEADIHERATVESVHSSTAIEGNPLNSAEVKEVINSEAPLDKHAYAQIEVLNYKKALDHITERRYGQTEITMDDVLKMHRIISKDLLPDEKSGKLRTGDVFVVNQRREILYTAAKPTELEREINGLLLWLRGNQFMIHPVIMAAVLHLHFVDIHPFADGNGRTARALTSLYLALSGYDCNGSLELDSYYATGRPAYYAILRQVNGASYETAKSADITPWLEYFTEGFVSSLHVLEAEIKVLNSSVKETR